MPKAYIEGLPEKLRFVGTSNTLVGTAGEYHVCAALCMQGFLALMTPKNNPLFDVVATSPDGSRSVSIQVKTRSVRNKQGWKFGAAFGSNANAPALYVVLVNLHATSLPDFYIYEYAEITQRVSQTYDEYIVKPKRDGSARKEVGFRWFDEVSFKPSDTSRKNNWGSIVRALQPAA